MAFTSPAAIIHICFYMHIQNNYILHVYIDIVSYNYRFTVKFKGLLSVKKNSYMYFKFYWKVTFLHLFYLSTFTYMLNNKMSNGIKACCTLSIKQIFIVSCTKFTWFCFSTVCHQHLNTLLLLLSFMYLKKKFYVCRLNMTLSLTGHFFHQRCYCEWSFFFIWGNS